MIEILIGLLIVILVFGIIWYAISLIPLPHPFNIIAQLILVVILLLVLLGYVLPLLHLPAVGR